MIPYCPLIVIYGTKSAMTRHFRTLCRSFVLTAATKVAVQYVSYFCLCNEVKKCNCIQYDHHMSLITNIAFAIIIGIALQEYEEENNLPH